jgi:hypothetical protein
VERYKKDNLGIFVYFLTKRHKASNKKLEYGFFWIKVVFLELMQCPQFEKTKKALKRGCCSWLCFK